MPEGPEVRRNTDYLNSVLQGTFIESLSILSGRYVRHGEFSGFDHMKIDNLFVENVSCKGKFIYFNFKGGASLWSTLGMSGIWQNKKSKHTRFVMTNNKGKSVFFNDVRNFGTLKYTRCAEELNKKLNKLGPDVLNTSVDPELFRRRFLSKPDKTITQNLMNQSVVSGIGNYLKAEVLYACQISPHRICKNITDEEYRNLREACHLITRLSYESGGATIASYRDANGDPGSFSRRFAVYAQKQDPLGNKVIKEVTGDKRMTHWVPEVQV